MSQLVQLQRRYAEFEERGATLVAIAQGSSDAETTLAILDRLDPDVPFELVTDPEREHGPMLDWMTTYLVDGDGIVRGILPLHRGMPLPWDVVLHELDALGAR